LILGGRLILGWGSVLGRGQFWIGRFLNGESPKVVDDELDMFYWGAGFG
jgi:hypothetical protein